MECKFCHASMEEEMTLCPECGKAVTEDAQVAEAAAEACSCCEGKAEEYTCCEETAEECACCEEMARPAKKHPAAVAIAVILAVVLAAALALGGTLLYKAAQSKSLPAEEFSITGMNSYTVPEAEMTEEKLTAGVALAEKQGIIRELRKLFGKEADLSAGLTNAELSIYYWDNFYSFYSNYGYYATMMGLNPATMDSTQGTEENQSWQELFLSQALSSYHLQQAVLAQGEKEGFVLPQETRQELDETREALESMEDLDAQLLAVYGPGVSFEMYMEYLQDQYYCGAYLSAQQEAIVPTDEELAAYFDANAETFSQQGLVRYAEGEAPDAKAEAEALYAQWQAGEATEESFAALAGEHTADPGSAETGGLYENVAQGEMVEAFDAWCFDPARKPGDTGIVETEHGFHIMYFSGKGEGETVNVRHILLKSVDPNAWKEAAASAYKGEKMEQYVAALQQEFVLEYDLEKIALIVPSQYTETAG